MSTPLEHDYIGFTEISSSMEKSSDHKLSSSYSSSTSSTLSTETDKTSALNLKQTELRLGLPGSESPERKPGSGVSFFGKDLEEKHNGYPISPLKKLVSGSKRGFLDTIDGSCGKWVFSGSNGSEVDSGKACVSNPVIKEVSGGVSQAPKPVQEKKNQVSGVNIEHGNIAPAAKAQVVGWPPIRAFRKNNMTSNLAKNNDELGSGCLYVKVSMEGAPYLRKVDLKTCNNYSELSSALEKMFSCFSIGQCGSHGLPGRDDLSESHLMDLLHGSEYLLSYEDRDGDWMLLGDVPWEMFTDSCRRLRIMKGSEAIGLAPKLQGQWRSARKETNVD